MKRLTFLIVLIAALVILPRGAFAQNTIDTKMLSSAGVKKIMAAAEAEALKNGWKLSISIVDVAGEPLAFQRMDGAGRSSVVISQGKARTAALFRRPTKALQDAVAAGTTWYSAIDGVFALQGGVPITVDGQVIGAIGVSGASAAQDEQVAMAGAAAVAN